MFPAQGDIQQIEAKLRTVQVAALKLAQEIQGLYASYLEALGQAVRQQLILASYHLCTQNYPEAFLQLSLNQRQGLQQDLQQLGEQTQQQLQVCLEILDLPEASAAQDGLDPAVGLEQQDRLEAAIAQILETTSQAGNQILQKSNILPGQELDLLLEVAAKAEASGKSVAGPNSLLNATVGPSDGKESENAKIAAIYLRLAEIEFTDSTTMAWRNQIRKLLGRFDHLRQEFELKQRERIVAEAAAAWRASWTSP